MLQGIGYSKNLEIASLCQVLRFCVSCLPDPCPQDSVREQGPRIQRCQSHFFFHIYPIADKTKVLLYNFFMDSTATLNQWRLVLNGIFDGEGFSDAPTFDETRHASICVEVYYSRPKLYFHHSRYAGRQLKFLYVAITRARKNLWIMDSSEAAGPMKVLEDPDPEDSSHPLHRCTGVARNRSRSGHQLLRYRVWRFHPLLKNG